MYFIMIAKKLKKVFENKKKSSNEDKVVCNNYMSDYLRIHIENKQPVQLDDLTNSLQALQREYKTFYKENSDKLGIEKQDIKLYINKVKEGSIIIDLMVASMPLIANCNAVIQFGSYLKDAVEYFVAKKFNDNKKYKKSTAKNIKDFIEVNAKDVEGSVIKAEQVHIENHNETIINNFFVFANQETNALQNKLSKYEEECEKNEEEQDITTFSKVMMYWDVANFNNEKAINKVIIEKIDKKSHRVVFLNENDKKQTMSNNVNYPDNAWQDLVYFVDIEVEKIQDKIQCYKVLKVYFEDTQIKE